MGSSDGTIVEGRTLVDAALVCGDGRRAARRPDRLAADPVDLDRRRRAAATSSAPRRGSSSAFAPPAARPSWSASATATRSPSASCAPRDPDAPTVLIYGHYDVQGARADASVDTRRRSSRRSATAASTRAAPPTTRATSCRCCTSPARWRAPASCRSTCACSSRARRRPAASAVDGAGCARTSAAPTPRSSSTAAWPTPQTPAITVGLRGIVMLDARRSATAERNLHSGMYGGSVLNALHVLHGDPRRGRARRPTARVREELRDGRRAAGRRRARVLGAAAAGRRADRRGRRPAGASRRRAPSTTSATAPTPSLEVNEIVGGEPRTVVPAVARATVSLRLAPGQDPARMRAVLERPAARRRCPRAPSSRSTRPRRRRRRCSTADEPALQLAARGAASAPAASAPVFVRSGRHDPDRRRDGRARLPGDRQRLRARRGRRSTRPTSPSRCTASSWGEARRARALPRARGAAGAAD